MTATYTLGSLSLGTVVNVDYGSSQRFAQTDFISSRGSYSEQLGQAHRTFTLTGYLLGSTRYNLLSEMDRIRGIGASLKLDTDYLHTVVFIKTVHRLRETNMVLPYQLDLEGAWFKQINSCDLTTGWTVDSGGGTLAVDTTNIREGAASLSLAGTIADGVASRLKYAPSASVDVSACSWISFDFMITDISNITSAYVKLYTDANNYTVYNFVALITSTGWIKIRIPRASFTDTGTLDLTNLTYFSVDVTKSGQRTYAFNVDDFGAYE